MIMSISWIIEFQIKSVNCGALFLILAISNCIMNPDLENKLAQLKSKIKSFPDFPKEGILFW